MGNWRNLFLRIRRKNYLTFKGDGANHPPLWKTRETSSVKVFLMYGLVDQNTCSFDYT